MTSPPRQTHKDYPLLKPGLVIISCTGGVVIDGGTRTVRINCATSAHELRKFLEAVDGRTDLDTIAASFPLVPRASIARATSVLLNADLLLMPRRQILDDSTDVPSGARNYLHRLYVAADGEVPSVIAQAVVVVCKLSDCELAKHIVSDLIKNGWSDSTVLDASELSARVRSQARDTLYVVLSRSELDRQWTEDIAAVLREGRRQWIRATYNDPNGYADIGPLFGPNCSNCLQCVLATHAASVASSQGEDTRCPSIDESMWASIVATGITYLLADTGSFLAGASLRRYDLKNWRSTTLVCTRLVGCRHFGVSDQPSATLHIRMPHLFDEYLRALSEAPGRGVLRGWQLPDSLGASVEDDAARVGIPLPEISESDDTLATKLRIGPHEPGLSLTRLAFLLKMCAGERETRGGMHRRWCANAGNLGSACILVRHGFIDNEMSMLIYQPESHTLADIDDSRTSAEQLHTKAHRLSALLANESRMSFIVASRLRRLFDKYSYFGLRLAALDAGVTLAQLTYVAEALELRYAIDWSPRTQEYESIGRFFYLNSVVRFFDVPSSVQIGTTRQFSDGHLTSPIDVTPNSLLANLTTWKTGEAESIVTSPQDVSVGGALCDNRGTDKEALVQAARDVLRQRRSVREFTYSLIDPHDIMALVEAMIEVDERQCLAVCSDGKPLGVDVAVMDKRDLAHSLYRFNHETKKLQSSGDVMSADQMSELYLQPELVHAPLHIFVSGSLSSAIERFGARGQQNLLQRYGFVANRLLIKAISLGYGGTIIAGVRQRGVEAYLGHNGYTSACALSIVIGSERRKLPG